MSILAGLEGGLPFVDAAEPAETEGGPGIFRTPTRPNPRHTPKSTGAQKGLYKHFVVAPVGIAVLKTGDVYVERVVPTHDELEAADAYYMGGRENPVTPTEIADLTDAGYGEFIVGGSGGPVVAGIGGDGIPYIDSDGVTAGEEADVLFEAGFYVFTDEGV